MVAYCQPHRLLTIHTARWSLSFNCALFSIFDSKRDEQSVSSNLHFKDYDVWRLHQCPEKGIYFSSEDRNSTCQHNERHVRYLLVWLFGHTPIRHVCVVFARLVYGTRSIDKGRPSVCPMLAIARIGRNVFPHDYIGATGSGSSCFAIPLAVHHEILCRCWQVFSSVQRLG